MKFCKDCNHAAPLFFVGQYARCNRRNFIVKLDPVTGGKEEEDALYCTVERRSYTHVETCGTEAKYFMPRSSFFQRLKERFLPW